MINFSNFLITPPKTLQLSLGVAGKEILTLSALSRSCQFLPLSDRTESSLFCTRVVELSRPLFPLKRTHVYLRNKSVCKVKLVRVICTLVLGVCASRSFVVKVSLVFYCALLRLFHIDIYVDSPKWLMLYTLVTYKQFCSLQRCIVWYEI